MTAQIDIAVHPSQRMLHLRLSGHFTLADVARYEVEFGKALRKLGGLPNAHLTLCDVSATAVSTRDVGEALQRVITRADYRSRFCAMVVQGALARMQARRIVDRPDVMIFDDVASARAWLLASARDAA